MIWTPVGYVCEEATVLYSLRSRLAPRPANIRILIYRSNVVMELKARLEQLEPVRQLELGILPETSSFVASSRANDPQQYA